jgi:hypothetical protein
MILNKNPSSTHNYSHTYSAHSLTIADERDGYEANKKEEAVKMFTTTPSLGMGSDENTDNRVPPPMSGPEVRDSTEENRLDDPISPLDIHKALFYYIQAAPHNHRAFLTTNLCKGDTTFVTALSSTWLIGRSRNCAIVVHDRSVSRCHAVVGYDVQQGFYLMDVGSSNGTYLNRKQISVLKRHALVDGDLITLCNLQFEFFIAA